MFEMIVGVLIGAFVTGAFWSRDFARLQEAHRRLLYEHETQQIEYFEFRKRFEEYRARFDPIDIERTGNVISLVKAVPLDSER